MGKGAWIVLAVALVPLRAWADFKPDDVSLKEGSKSDKGGFVATGSAEANGNNLIKLACGSQRVYGYEVTDAAANTGHYELTNAGGCDLTATVEIVHVQDKFGTTVREQVSMAVPRGRHGSVAFPIGSDPQDKKKFVVITIKCEVKLSTGEEGCAFEQNLTVGARTPPKGHAPPAQSDIRVRDGGEVTPPGMAAGGSEGSKCVTDPKRFVEVYTFYNTLPRSVEVRFTVANLCLCKELVARIDSARFNVKTDQPLGSKPGTPAGSANRAAPPKNDAKGEKGERQVRTLVKTGRSITVKVGCRGPNNPSACKGQVKDIELILR